MFKNFAILFIFSAHIQDFKVFQDVQKLHKDVVAYLTTKDGKKQFAITAKIITYLLLLINNADVFVCWLTTNESDN